MRVGETFVERSGSFHATAVALNGAIVPSPGDSTWSPQTVKNVLTHPLYRGEYRHGAMRTVARGGTLVRVRGPEAEVLRIAHPELRIWPAALLAQIDAALARPRRKAWGVATPRHLAYSFAAVLGKERLVATPIEVKGSRRWQLAGQISAGYLMSHVVKEASDSLTTWCFDGEPIALLATA